MKNKVLILNHVFWPDQHGSARNISELAEELHLRGWDVDVWMGNRSYIDPKRKFTPRRGVWNGVKYRRFYVPPFDQGKNISRLLTAFWLINSWIWHVPFMGRYDAIILGTIPPFSFLVLPVLKMFQAKTKLLLWGFDIYPEAIMVSGGALWNFLGKCIKPITKVCYRQLDVVVDIGPCMRSILSSYNHGAKMATLTPWSFIEPDGLLDQHADTRKELFKDASLALLYSGTIGYAHEFENFLSVARELREREASVGFCFAGFGNGFKNLKTQISEEDTNITIGGYVETDFELQQRLSSPDIMLICLKSNWTGIAVPSKFFGAMAAGKAILFSGSRDSALSVWLKEYELGFHLDHSNIQQTADLLMALSEDLEKLKSMQVRAQAVYRSKFSKKVVCDGWSDLLKSTIQAELINH